MQKYNIIFTILLGIMLRLFEINTIFRNINNYYFYIFQQNRSNQIFCLSPSILFFYFLFQNQIENQNQIINFNILVVKKKQLKQKKNKQYKHINISIKMDSDKPSCPVCQSKDKVVKIIYGHPAEKLIKQAERKEIFLGGCKLPPRDIKPEGWYCFTCTKKFD
ncbi:transmembrane protein, putative (macronuclear) [Tetrahymena thermophila SB210]|uniref:Transmembrane protein, putative n=1 Tax=Tetrahymena thermophila (strain SB210) TaxID=312017 RepID=W7XJ97_TETTS|nr:transmembrane protein, putative [Tetrahymena thermophila SB210]EWS75326.1 transmembrane protein, putative [Tetrahymena thermophila SB210]|eukprot:XP_012652138.1 transmembrane protein, putative [Tetrahymena thermophila SB210]